MFVLFQFHINCPTSSPPLSLSRCVLGCKEVQHCREAPGMQSGNNIKAHIRRECPELPSPTCLLNLVERVACIAITVRLISHTKSRNDRY